MVSIYDLTGAGLLPPGPTSPGGGLMNEYGDLMRQSQRQRAFNALTAFGTGLMQAGMGGPWGQNQGNIATALQATNQALQADPMDMMRARYMMAQIEKMERDAAKGPDRETDKDVTGRLRYRDTGELVYPGVTAPAEPPETRTVTRGNRTVTEEFDPQTGAWSEIGGGPRWQPRQPTARPTDRGADGYLYYTDTGERVLPDVSAPIEPLETRTVNRGGQEVTEEFDPDTGAWSEIGGGPRWQPQRPAARPTAQGADGYLYYTDTGERVLPNVSAPLEPREARTVNRGGQEVTEEFDPQTGKWIRVSTAPRWKQPDILDPDVEAARIRIAQESRPQVTVEAPQIETEFQKALGKQQGKTFNEIQQGARDAMAQNQNLAALNQALDQVYTGTGGQALQSARKVAKLLGAEGLEGEIAAGEAGQALSGRLALQLRNPAGGAGMPGAMSDADRAFLQSLTPTITTSPEGRRLVTEVLKRQNQRAIDVAGMARDYLEENGNMIGFEQRLAAEFASDPSEDLFADLALPAQTPAAAPSSAGKTYRYDPSTDTMVEQ